MYSKSFLQLVTVAAVLAASAIPAHSQTQFPVTINVGSGAGQPGSLVTIDVTLDIGANLVAGTDNTITVASPLGIVGCRLAPQFQDTLASQVVYEPDGCEGDPEGACTQARGLIINDNVEPIAGSNVLLYSCDVRIAFDAVEGTYPITCSDALASNPQGQPYNGSGRCRQSVSTPCVNDEDCASVGGTCRVLSETLCPNSMVEVSGSPLPTFTVTPTGTITPTATETSTPTPTPTGIFGVLAADVGETDQTIPLVDSSAFGESGTVAIGSERITYRAKVGDDLTEAQRGKSGTTPMAYQAGTRVDLIASNSGGAGGGRGCAIGPSSEGNALGLFLVAAILSFLRFRARRVGRGESGGA